jgi:2'-hydroxyisoflavone reductase
MTSTRREVLMSAPLAMAAGTAARAAPAVKPMRLLILGGTGFTGPHQVRYALARGHKVTVFNRGRHPQDWPGQVEELVGDRNTGDLASLRGRQWDVCIDNPTTLPFWVRDAAGVLKGNVGHYVFISTISVYAKNDTPGADETAALSAYEGNDPFAERQVTNHLYGQLKAVSEGEARAQFGEAHTTIIRPGLIVGPGDETDRFTYWPVRLARGGEVLAPSAGGADPVQFVDARDLAEWTVRMAERRQSGVFNATGPARAMTVHQMLDGVGKGVKSSPPLTWVPAEWLEAHKVYGWSDLPVWVPGHGETAGFSRRSNRRAVAAGLSFRPLPATAADTLAWFRTQPAERQAKLRAGLAPEREAALLKDWKAKA